MKFLGTVKRGIVVQSSVRMVNTLVTNFLYVTNNTNNLVNLRRNTTEIFENWQMGYFRFRRYLIVFVMMLLWVAEALIQLNYANSGILLAIEILEAFQGIFVMMLFVVNRDSLNHIKNRMKALKKKNRRKEKREHGVEGTEMIVKEKSDDAQSFWKIVVGNMQKSRFSLTMNLGDSIWLFVFLWFLTIYYLFIYFYGYFKYFLRL